MRNHQAIELRKKIMTMRVGDVFECKFKGADHAQVSKAAKQFARAREMPIDIREVDGRTVIERMQQWPGRGRPTTEAARKIAAMVPGDSITFDVGSAKHQAIRLLASARNKLGEVRVRCSAEGAAIVVSCFPADHVPTKAAEEKPAPAPRRSKYGLERLETERELVLTPVRFQDVGAMRLAVSTKARTMGWRLSAHLRDDGTLLVTRKDLAQGAE